MRALAHRAGPFYSPFPLVKRPRPFQQELEPPKVRVIDNPLERLKSVQRLINERVLKTIVLPENINGGVKGKSTLDNISLHKDSNVLVKIDIARFFPSISNRHVYTVWRNLLDCSPEISAILTRLTTFERHLPQGAPTSTMLANLVLYSLDKEIREGCKHRGITYSSWIDDLAFSSDNPREIIGIVVGTLGRNGFRISRRKLEITGSQSRKVLNGSVLGRVVSVPRERLARVRSGIHKLRTRQVPADEVARYVRSLRGSIAQIGMANQVKAQRFGRELEAALASVGLGYSHLRKLG